MKVSLGLPTHRVDLGGELVGGAAVTEVARAAEASGFDAVFVTDHPFPGDSWLSHGGHHTLDPLITLAVVAANTTRLRLHTNLMILAYRNPFISAKAVATLDVLSGGRVVLGVGAGYLEPEFAALGVDFSERNALDRRGSGGDQGCVGGRDRPAGWAPFCGRGQHDAATAAAAPSSSDLGGR